MPVRRLLGDDIDRPLWPVLAVAFAGSVAGSSFYGFQGIWALEVLGASERQLGLTLLAEAICGAAFGYAGGRFSDHVGRRPVLLASWIGQAAFLVVLASVDGIAAGLALMVAIGSCAALGWSASQALVADVVASHRHEAGFAAQRVAMNLGVAVGPPLGGLILLADSWTILWVTVAALLVATAGLALRLLPAGRTAAVPHAEARAPLAVIVRNPAFMLFLTAMIFAALAFVASETLLPVMAVTQYDLSPSLWGAVAVLNPIAVALFQLRITAWTAAIPIVAKVIAAMGLMGGSLLLLPINHSLPVIIVVIAVFVIGEMLWVPTSQAVITRMAPADQRGAYLGAAGATWAIGFSLGPLIGLQLLQTHGDAAAWAFYAAGCGVGAVTAAVAAARVAGAPARAAEATSA